MPCLWLVNRFPDRWHDNGKGQACIGGMVETSETELQQQRCVSKICLDRRCLKHTRLEGYSRTCVLKCKPTYSADEAAPKDDGLPVKQIPQLRIPAGHAGVPPRMLLRC